MIPNYPRHNLSVALGLWLALAGFCAARADETGVAAPEGFLVSPYAGDHLAHDIYSMTIDARGRVVVSGQGYTRILIDDDNDGRADRYTTFADGPSTGAQGMHFEGHDLLCVGDAGLLRYRDRDEDDRADGAPEVLLPIRTGGEHHAHAIRRGPDGYWYLLAGNDSQVTSQYVTDERSPIKEPRAGVLLRLPPDFSSCAVVMDGLRNAYDFDFHPSGTAFVYDSDDERDVTLPWYRPTRVFQVVPGADAGWVSRSWKFPNRFPAMPPVAAALGRGSPTGVVCYRHHAFPDAYRASLFVADWTFGRVYHIPLMHDKNTASWLGEPEVFLRGVGQHGFAPTDLEVAPDGALLVSVGGRGTRGGVLRVVWNGEGTPNNSSDVPQPLASWSRRQWEPTAQEHFPTRLIATIAEQRATEDDRVRAIEQLAMLGGTDQMPNWESQLTSWPFTVRRAVATALGRGSSLPRPSQSTLLLLLEDADSRVICAALESLLYAGGVDADPSLEPALIDLLKHDTPLVRHLAARALSNSARTDRSRWLQIARELPSAGKLTACLALVERSHEIELPVFDLAHQVFLNSDERSLQFEAIRIMQLALGDVGPRANRDAVFDGYAPRQELAAYQDHLVDAIQSVASAYPTGDEQLDAEIERWLALVAADVPGLLSRVLDQITDASHPTGDIHALIVAARLGGSLGYEDRHRIAAALAALEHKVQRAALHEDRNWAPRLRELFSTFIQRDPLAARDFVNDAAFGDPAHAIFLDLLPSAQRQRALDRILTRNGVTASVASPELLMALGESARRDHREALREFAELPAVANLALIALARRPDEADRHYYYEGVRSNSFDTVVSCLGALERMPAPSSGDQFAALVSALDRLGGDAATYEARERIARLLERAVPEAFGFQFGKGGYRPQPDVIERWREWLKEKYPVAAEKIAAAPRDLNWLDDQLAGVDWTQGDATRGGEIFQSKGCHQCHGGRNALGPDLAGVTGRFSLRDLFTSIAFPSLHVSPRYQTTVIETLDGRVYQGAIVYDSVDGVTLISGANQTVRIEAADIAERLTSPISLMPSGLLDGLTPLDYANLFSYLKTLDGGS